MPDCARADTAVICAFCVSPHLRSTRADPASDYLRARRSHGAILKDVPNRSAIAVLATPSSSTEHGCVFWPARHRLAFPEFEVQQKYFAMVDPRPLDPASARLSGPQVKSRKKTMEHPDLAKEREFYR